MTKGHEQSGSNEDEVNWLKAYDKISQNIVTE